MIRRENGDTIDCAYVAADRLASEKWKGAGMETICGFAWDYDGGGNRTYQRQIGGGGTAESPDAKGRRR